MVQYFTGHGQEVTVFVSGLEAKNKALTGEVEELQKIIIEMKASKSQMKKEEEPKEILLQHSNPKVKK